MKNVAIIGAGQLGSRHLQGLKLSKYEMNIWVMDSNPESLEIAEQRYNQVQDINKKDVHYIQNIDLLPDYLDLVIVATGSKPRALITKKLLDKSKVQNLILEKFLFPRLSDYDEIGELLLLKNCNCWVNCPRRMFEHYYEIKKIMVPGQTTMNFEGQDWGLCCNTIHFLDIFMYLTNSKLYSVDISGLKPSIIQSKRNGYIELLGTVKFETDKEDELQLSSLETFDKDACVRILNGQNKIIIQESGDGVWTLNGEKHPFRALYQSQLTGTLADELFDTGTCRLTPYSQSAEYHKPFLSALIAFVNKIQGWDNDSCPIT